MGGDAVDPQGFGVADQVPEDTEAARQAGLGQIGAFLIGQTGSDELLQVLPGFVEYAQCPVAGANQVHGGGHDTVQHRGQLHLPADGHHGIEQTL